MFCDLLPLKKVHATFVAGIRSNRISCVLKRVRKVWYLGAGLTKSGLMSSEESLFVLAQLHWWCLMLFKSGLRKSQSCCWQSLFSAPGVSIAPGHEAHRIYAGDKEGGFHNAWWSASDTLPQSDPCFSGCGKICEETLKIMANKCLYSDQVLRIIVLKSEIKDGGKKYLKVRERLMVYEWKVSRLWGSKIRFSA